VSVDVSFEQGRAHIILNRPDVLNALDFEAFDALAAACSAIVNAPDVKVVVVSGAGRAFCSGIDLGALTAPMGGAGTMIARAQAGFRALAGLGVPTVAAIHGYALGAGLQLALACDLRVMTRDAVVGLLELKFGIIPDLGGTQRLPALVGPASAKKMIWLQEKIDGAEAYRRGLAEFFTEPEELQTTATELAAQLADAPPDAVRAVKRLIDASGTSTNEGLDAEAAEQAPLLDRLLSS